MTIGQWGHTLMYYVEVVDAKHIHPIYLSIIPPTTSSGSIIEGSSNNTVNQEGLNTQNNASCSIALFVGVRFHLAEIHIWLTQLGLRICGIFPFDWVPSVCEYPIWTRNIIGPRHYWNSLSTSWHGKFINKRTWQVIVYLDTKWGPPMTPLPT